MKIFKSGIGLLALLLLSGCVVTSETNSKNESVELISNRINILESEFTLNTEDNIIYLVDDYVNGRYYFNGFSNEDTFVFSDDTGGQVRLIYQKAGKGRKFQFKDIENIEFTVMDFNRDENYIKLKSEKIKNPKIGKS